MSTVSLVEFRRNAEAVIGRVQRGERIVLTRRGRPVLRLEPMIGPDPAADDPIYRLHESAAEEGETLDDREIDRIVYGL
ncbi:MAG: type II toxin-antitoxin system prevent-host-death family antitoxin [Planctomycetes bacterium]|jgi:prevent-host-death family protein|nr:type II toxin-antitoxin system prevent-host-death family antitoxin [Planctomycetota bacterium]